MCTLFLGQCQLLGFRSFVTNIICYFVPLWVKGFSYMDVGHACDRVESN
jgi:hypothetical protein